MINIGFRLCYLGIFHYHLWLQTWIQFTKQFMGKYTWHSREYAIWAKSATKQTRDRVIVCHCGSSGFWLQSTISMKFYNVTFVPNEIFFWRTSPSCVVCRHLKYKTGNWYRSINFNIMLYLLYFYLKWKLKCVKFVLLFNFLLQMFRVRWSKNWNVKIQ